LWWLAGAILVALARSGMHLLRCKFALLTWHRRMVSRRSRATGRIHPGAQPPVPLGDRVARAPRAAPAAL